MGWGILHGVLFGLAVAVTCVMLALELTPRHVIVTLIGAAAVGVVIGALFFANLPHAVWVWVGDQVDTSTTLAIDPAYRPLVVAAVSGLVVGAVLGLIVGIWKVRTFSGSIASLFGGAIALAAFFAFTAISFSAQCAIGLGIALTLAVWPVLVARPVIDGSFDWDALGAKYWPGLTIETAQATIEELKRRIPSMPSRPSMPRGRDGR
jgi:hypothetical protein